MKSKQSGRATALQKFGRNANKEFGIRVILSLSVSPCPGRRHSDLWPPNEATRQRSYRERMGAALLTQSPAPSSCGPAAHPGRSCLGKIVINTIVMNDCVTRLDAAQRYLRSSCRFFSLPVVSPPANNPSDKSHRAARIPGSARSVGTRRCQARSGRWAPPPARRGRSSPRPLPAVRAAPRSEERRFTARPGPALAR